MPKWRLVFDGDNIYTEKEARVYKLKQDISSKIDAIPWVIDSLDSTSTTDALSANMGRELQDQISALSGNFHFLSTWDCTTWLPGTNPAEDPYVYQSWDYYIVSTVAWTWGTNYKPHWASYVQWVPSTTVETGTVNVNDWYVYDWAVWVLQPAWSWHIIVDDQMDATSTNPVQNRVITNALAWKQAVISNLSAIEAWAAAWATALQPNDNITQLVNNAWYQTSWEVISAIDWAIHTWTTAPANPTEWQLWYDTTNDVLKVYDWTNWNTVSWWGGGTVYTAWDNIDITNDTISATNVITTDNTNWVGFRIENSPNFIDTTSIWTVDAGSESDNSEQAEYSLASLDWPTPWIWLEHSLSVYDPAEYTSENLSLDLTGIYSSINDGSETTDYEYHFYPASAWDLDVIAKLGDIQNVIYSWTTAPQTPTEWQLWYDTTNDVLKVYDWTSWNVVWDDAANINTKTFKITNDQDITNAQAALDWYLAWKNPILIHDTSGGWYPASIVYTLRGGFGWDGLWYWQIYFTSPLWTDSLNNELRYWQITIQTGELSWAGWTDGVVNAVEISLRSLNDGYLYLGNQYRGVAQTIYWTKTFNTSPVVPNKTTDATNTGTAIATEAQVYKKQDTLTAWSHINITSNTISTKGLQEELVAWDYINIEDNVVSATGLQEELTAWTNITITPSVESDMKWPAPAGFHVPTVSEWNAAANVWYVLHGWNTDGRGLAPAYKLPRTGVRSSSDAKLYYKWYNGYYWTSTRADADSVYIFKIDNNNSYYINQTSQSANWHSIRCFKNIPVVPDSSWTTIYDWSSVATWAWVFHNTNKWLISMSKDWTTWITIADKNLWATKVYNNWDVVNSANCWYYYQWWNNYSFPWADTSESEITTSDVQVDATNYWPGNYYKSSTFIISNTSPYEWDTSDNYNLWWWVSGWLGSAAIISATGSGATYTAWNNIQISAQNVISATDTTYTAWDNIQISAGNVISATDTTYIAWDGISIDSICHSDMQWPCSDGYHVPLSSELRTVLEAWVTLGAWTKDTRNNTYGTDIYTYFYVPMCWYMAYDWRYFGPELIPMASLWCSDAGQNGGPYCIWGTSSSVNLSSTIMPAGYWTNIRPFKDTPVIPDAQSQDWTQTYQWTWDAWVWHNATEWIISISADGTNWYTLADKNLWATVVYNTWDTVDVTNGGYLYQWWNCQEFPMETVTDTITWPVDPTGYGPGNYYFSDFIVDTNGNIRNPVNTNIWWAVSQWSSCGEIISSTVTGWIISSNNTYNNIIHLSQAEYDSLIDRDPNTLYSTPEWASTTAKYWLEKEYDAIVDAAWNWDYTTIWAAVDAGKRKIFVKDWTYNETQGHFVTLWTTWKLVIIWESQTWVVVNVSLTEVQTQWSEYRNYPAFLFVDAQNTTDAEVEIKKMTVNASINTTVTIASFLKIRTDDGWTTNPNILNFYIEDCKFYAENVWTSYAAFNIVTRNWQPALWTNDIYNCIITVIATNWGLRYGWAEEVVREENCIYKNCNFIARTSENTLTIGFNVLNAFDCSFNANSDMCTWKLSVDIENADNCDIYFWQCVNKFDMLFINIRNSTINLWHYGDYTRDRIPTNTIIPYWQGSTAYALWDMVIYNWRLYKCNTAHTSNADTSWDSEEYDKRDGAEVRIRDIYWCHIWGGHTLFEFGWKVSNNEISFLGTWGDVFFDEWTMFNSNELILWGWNAYMNSRTIFKWNNLSNYSWDVYYNNSKNNIITNNISWATNIFKAVWTWGTSVVNDNITYS